jgi:hypothetical protein
VADDAIRRDAEQRSDQPLPAIGSGRSMMQPNTMGAFGD